MPITYEVKLEPTATENSFRITWTDLSDGKQYAFDQSARDISPDEIARL